MTDQPRPKRVLIADDDRVVSHLLSSRLRALGWKVDVAADAMQAVMFAMRTPPDVITLDINMPGGTGIEALRKLKQSMKCQAHHIPGPSLVPRRSVMARPGASRPG